jgi:hypothetical protein
MPYALVPNPNAADGQPVFFGSGDTGVVQVYDYINDPIAEDVIPVKTSLPAMAYRKTGDGPTYVWNTDTYTWV